MASYHVTSTIHQSLADGADGTEEDQWAPGVERVPEPKVG
jgi:hypothetical protein